MRPAAGILAIGLLFGVVLLGVHVGSQRRLGQQVRQAAVREALLPKRVLWVWERPEDLRAVESATTGVAVLEETLRVGSRVTPVLRHQPVLLPRGMSRTVVVRLETEPRYRTAEHESALLPEVVADLERVAWRPGIAALQIDFDAGRSERAFYRQLLRKLRPRMPVSLPLEMTALVSWCSTDDWIGDLPVNAATPMYFRMEPDRRRMRLEQAAAYRVREPLCASSLGVSTAEPWPSAMAGRRVYLFADHGWKTDLSVVPGMTVSGMDALGKGVAHVDTFGVLVPRTEAKEHP